MPRTYVQYRLSILVRWVCGSFRSQTKKTHFGPPARQVRTKSTWCLVTSVRTTRTSLLFACVSMMRAGARVVLLIGRNVGQEGSMDRFPFSLPGHASLPFFSKSNWAEVNPFGTQSVQMLQSIPSETDPMRPSETADDQMKTN